MTDPNGPYTAGASATVMFNTFTRAGHVFNGWNTAADGSGTAYQPTNTITIGQNNVQLYAQWVKVAQKPVIKIPTGGTSIPTAPTTTTLGGPLVTGPTTFRLRKIV